MTNKKLYWIIPLSCLLAGYVLFRINNLLILSFFIIIALVFISMIKPDIATVVVVFTIYSNIGAVAYQFYGIPKLLASSVILLLGLPLVVFLVVRKKRIVINYIFLFMILFLLVQLLSSIFAKDVDSALSKVYNFIIEGIVLYMLLINVIRRYGTLHWVIWALIISGSMMGGFSTYQEITKSYDNNFGGFAQMGGKITVERGIVSGKVQRGRSAGSIGEKNRYAQNMLVLLPLALFMLWSRKSWQLKFITAVGLLLILGGLLLTFSRGGFVGLSLLFIILLFLKSEKIPQILMVGFSFFLIIILFLPDYLTRMQSLVGVEDLFSSQKNTGHVILSRTSENIAAFEVFLKHPILGVGPQNYILYSLEYKNRYGLIRDDQAYKTHSLYLELLSETGILGFGVFMTIIFLILSGLWQTRNKLLNDHPDLSDFATALLLSIIGYLATGLFLQLSYQRFFWLIIGVASSAIYCLPFEAENRDKLKNEANYRNEIR